MKHIFILMLLSKGAFAGVCSESLQLSQNERLASFFAGEKQTLLEEIFRYEGKDDQDDKSLSRWLRSVDAHNSLIIDNLLGDPSPEAKSPNERILDSLILESPEIDGSNYTSNRFRLLVTKIIFDTADANPPIDFDNQIEFFDESVAKEPLTDFQFVRFAVRYKRSIARGEIEPGHLFALTESEQAAAELKKKVTP